MRPPPCSTTGASWVRAVLPHAGPAVDTLVPSKTANGEPAPADSGDVDERICPPGAATSGLSEWPKFVGAADEKLVTMPLRPVTISTGPRPAEMIVRPPFCAR